MLLEMYWTAEPLAGHSLELTCLRLHYNSHLYHTEC